MYGQWHSMNSSSVELIIINFLSIKILSFVECDELLYPNNALSIRVTVIYHLLYFSCTHFFFEFLCCGQEVFFGNEALVILIKVLEDSFDVLFSIIAARFLCHQFDELFEGNLTAIIGVEDWHGHIDEWSSRVISSKLSDRFTEIHGGEHAVVVFVEEIKDLLEDLDIPYWTLGHHVLFWIEIYIFLSSKAWLLSTFFRGMRFVQAFFVTSFPSAVLRLSGNHKRLNLNKF